MIASKVSTYFPVYTYALLTSLDLALTFLGIRLNIASEANPAGVNGVVLLKIVSIGLIILLYQQHPKYGRIVATIGCSVALVCVALWVSLFGLKIV